MKTENSRALFCGDLFDLATDGLKRTRKSYAGEIAALKTQYGIFTHICRGGGDWLALSMPECCNALSGYGLTEDEKTNGVALMAGYCRLLDEAGLVEEGQKTEREAVNALVARLRSNSDYQTPSRISNPPTFAP